MRKLLQIPLLILAMLLFGAISLQILTGQRFLICFYQAFILLATVGSQEPPQMTDATMGFIIVYLALGLGVFAYSAFQFGQILVNSDIRSVWEQRAMEKEINKLSGHFIICGFGRMGHELCDYLYQRNQRFVVIDEEEDLLTPEMRQDGWLFLCGDATQDEVLERAGIANARALTKVLPTDADNLYVVLSARLLNNRLQIVARASNDTAVRKMQQAGATRVINPLSSGAIRMARFMLSPSIENFVEVAESEGVDWEIADVQVPEGSHLVNKRLKDTSLREDGIMLLGVRRENGDKIFPPPGDLVIMPHDSLFAFGNSVNLAQLTKLLESSKTPV
ncbi:MAG: potassium channel protein [Fuerstiella sp.]